MLFYRNRNTPNSSAKITPPIPTVKLNWLNVCSAMALVVGIEWGLVNTQHSSLATRTPLRHPYAKGIQLTKEPWSAHALLSMGRVFYVIKNTNQSLCVRRLNELMRLSDICGYAWPVGWKGIGHHRLRPKSFLQAGITISLKAMLSHSDCYTACVHVRLL